MARARVIVTTYERPAHLRRALEALKRQSTHDFALTVADDGSGRETAEVVAAFAATAPFPVAHSWWAHDGYRRSGVLNKAVRESAGEPLLVFTDGDCVPPASWVERQLAAHTTRSFHVAGCVPLEEQETAALSVEDIVAGRHERFLTDAALAPLCRRARRTRWRTWLRRPGHPRVNGLNVAVDREAFLAINGYDEAFVGWGHEDQDLRDRLMRLRPRPVVRVLFGLADTIHLWHPATSDRKQEPNAGYYGTARPVRCVEGLLDERGPRPTPR